jgi:uncharacterized ParB-like nuclease family protein
MSKPSEAPKVWPVQMIPVVKIHRDPKNTQKQSRKVFAELKKNIAAAGFDEPIVVIPHPDKPGEYMAVAGNHRTEAARALGMVEVPAVVRTDWDVVTAQLQSVRRNYARGQIDKDAFATLVNELEQVNNVSLEEIYSGMGFSDVEDFAEMYRKEKEETEKIQRTTNESAPKVKMMDDLGIILSSIFESYGSTAPFSFIIFPAGEKHHVFVQSSNALKRVLTDIMAACVEKGFDVNTALAGLLQIGSAHTNFLKKDEKKNELVLDAAEELTEDEADTDFEAI